MLRNLQFAFRAAASSFRPLSVRSGQPRRTAFQCGNRPSALFALSPLLCSLFSGRLSAGFQPFMSGMEREPRAPGAYSVLHPRLSQRRPVGPPERRAGRSDTPSRTAAAERQSKSEAGWEPCRGGAFWHGRVAKSVDTQYGKLLDRASCQMFSFARRPCSHGGRVGIMIH